ATGARSPEQPRRAAVAAATSLPLLVVTMILAGVAAWAARRFSTGEQIEIGSWPQAIDAPRWAVALAIALMLLNVGVPTASLLVALRVKLDLMQIWTEFAPAVQGSMAVA